MKRVVNFVLGFVILDLDFGRVVFQGFDHVPDVLGFGSPVLDRLSDHVHLFGPDLGKPFRFVEPDRMLQQSALLTYRHRTSGTKIFKHFRLVPRAISGFVQEVVEAHRQRGIHSVQTVETVQTVKSV